MLQVAAAYIALNKTSSGLVDGKQYTHQMDRLI